MPDTQAVSVKKDDRIYIRTTQAQKQALARAARARHLHTTEFILQVSLQVAEQVIAEEEKILLSERDFARFVELIDNPPPPTDSLRAAMTEYQRLKAAHPEANL